MRVEDFLRQLRERASLGTLQVEIAPSCSARELEQAEGRLGVEFPRGARLLYGAMNGFDVKSPALRLLPVGELVPRDDGLVVFSVFDSRHRLAWNTRSFNAAGEWDVIEAESKYVVTMTMGSFWSNKVWAWLERGRCVWAPEEHV